MPSRQCHFSGRELVDAVRHPQTLHDMPLARWDALLRVAKRANLIGRLALGVRNTGIRDELPMQVRAHLDSTEVLITHQRAAIEWETRHIARALAALEGPIVLLKGAAYACSGLRAAEGRLFGDVDVLVPRHQLNAAEAALMLEGWTSGHPDAYDERYYREWMHEIPPMTHRGRGTVIDLHHNILPLSARTSPDAGLLLAACQPLSGTPFSTFSPVDMVIHSATHLFHESELQNGLRDLFDLDALLGEFSACSPTFWDELAERAIQLGLALPLALALRHAAEILETPSPPRVRTALERAARLGSVSRQALDAIYSRALMPDHPLSGDRTMVLARLAVYMRGHYLRMPLGRLTAHLGRKFFLRLFRNTSRSH